MAPASTQPSNQIRKQSPHHGPELIIRWESFWPVFLANLTDTLLRREPPPLALTSRPAPFWTDVFVHRPMPWKNFAQSGSIHFGLIVLIYTTGHLWFARQPTLQDRYSHTTITYYNVAEELPALATPKPAPRPREPLKGDPELAKQQVISVPTNADNSTQTIINLPHPKVLRQEVQLPNMMVWTEIPAPPVDSLKSQVKIPRLEMPALPPSPDISRLRARNQSKLTVDSTVAAPPEPEVKKPAVDEVLAAEPALKKPAVDLTLAAAPDVAVPEPKLDLPVSKPLPGAALSQTAKNVGPPPAPSAPAAVASAPATGPQPAGQMLTLSVRPAPPAAEIKVPDGSRSGVFEAGPTGRTGAAGTPNIPASGGAADKGTGTGNTPTPGSGSGNGASPIAGITVAGAAKPNSGAVVAAPPPAKPSGAASGPSPFSRIDRPPIPVYPPADRKTEPTGVESRVFGTRKSYSMSLNMANLTSSGGSWIIRFAELKESTAPGDLSTPTVMNKVDPAYPPDLIKDQVEGVVTLYAVIHADGTVGEVRLLQGLHERLDENAMKALVRWHFRPAMKNGVPVDLEAVVSVPFKARRLTGF